MSAGRMTALVLSDTSVFYLSFVVLLVQVTLWSLLYWQPLLIKDGMPEAPDYKIAIVSALPHLCGVLGTYGLGKMSSNASCRRRSRDETSRTERRWHSSIAMIVGGASLSLATSTLGTNSLVVPFVLLCLANGCLWAVGGLLLTWPRVWLSQQAAVVALAVLNMASAVGGLVGPALVGFLTQAVDDDGVAVTGTTAVASVFQTNRSADSVLIGEWASGLGSGEDSGILEGSDGPASTTHAMLSMPVAVGLLGGCAIAAGLMAGCFRPRAKVAPPRSCHVQMPTWHEEVSVLAV